MQYRLRNELTALGRDPDELCLHLFTAGSDILPTHNRGVRRRFERVLGERGVVLHRDSEVRQVSAGGLTRADGQSWPHSHVPGRTLMSLSSFVAQGTPGRN